MILGNKLDCSCQLSTFQSWIKNSSVQLDAQSIESAKCETPRSKSNAALVDLPPLMCTDSPNGSNDRSFLPFEEEDPDEHTSSNIDPNELNFVNWSFDEINRLLHISWLPQMNMSYYGCDQVQVQCVPTVEDEDSNPGKSNPKEVYSKPLECNDLTNYTLINVVRVLEIICGFPYK